MARLNSRLLARQCKAKTLSSLACLGQHSAPWGAHIVDFLNVSILWWGGCWVDKESGRKQRESRGKKPLICQIYHSFYPAEEEHSIMFIFLSSEASFCCSSSNPFWNIAISARLCFRAIYTCFSCPCASCFTSPGIPRTLSHLFLISVSIFCTAAAVRGSAVRQNFSFMTVGSWSPVISEPYHAVRYMGHRSKLPYGSKHRMMPGML